MFTIAAYKFLSAFLSDICSCAQGCSCAADAENKSSFAMKWCKQWPFAVQHFKHRDINLPQPERFPNSEYVPGGPHFCKTKTRFQRHLFRSAQSTMQNLRLRPDAISTPSATAQLKGIFAEENVTLKR